MESQNFVLKIVAIIMALCAVLGGVSESGISSTGLFSLFCGTEKSAKILLTVWIIPFRARKKLPSLWVGQNCLNGLVGKTDTEI